MTHIQLGYWHLTRSKTDAEGGSSLRVKIEASKGDVEEGKKKMKV